jgi:DNA (cytosine-5)-methyltransferase 1
MNNNNLKVLDLFAGAGGFSLGFKLAGCDLIGAIEQDKWASETFAYNHPMVKVITDKIENITDANLGEIFKNKLPNIILGGLPCQGFSICTKNAGDPNDHRNSLFTEFIRVIKFFKPEYLIIENVPNLLRAKDNNNELIIQIISKQLKALKYHVYYDVLEASDYGVPQIRKRLFVIGSIHPLKQPFPQPTHYLNEEELPIFKSMLKKCPTLWEAIADLPKISAREGAEEMDYTQPPQHEYQREMRLGSAKVYNHVAMKHSQRTVERFSLMSHGDSLANIPEHLKPFKRNNQGVISDKIYEQNSRRMHPNKPCHTIPASFYANFVHPYQHRNFTAREGARIQSFPDWYIFKGKPTVVSQKLLHREGRFDEKYLCQYNQIGNAVPPLLAKVIAENLLQQI